MKRLFRPAAEIGIVAGAVAVGVTVANPILGTIVGGIAINLASNLTGESLHWSEPGKLAHLEGQITALPRSRKGR